MEIPEALWENVKPLISKKGITIRKVKGVYRIKITQGLGELIKMRLLTLLLEMSKRLREIKDGKRNR